MNTRIVLLALFFLIILSACQQKPPSESKWEEVVATGAPTARHEAAMVAFKNKLYLIGGRRINPVDVFDPATALWEEKSPTPIELHHFQGVVLGDAIYVVGAMTGGWPNEVPVDRVIIYYPEKDEFVYGHEIPEHRRRGGAGAVAYKGKIYVVGGITHGHMSGNQSWLDEYDPATGQWRELQDAPYARDHFLAAVVQDKLYAFAGRTTSQATNQGFPLLVKHGNVFDLETEVWAKVTDNLAIPTARAGNLVAVWNNEVIVGGGESHTQEKAHSEVEAYNVVSQTWRQWPGLNTGRHGSDFAAIDGYLYAASGSGNRGGGPELTSVERYKLPVGTKVENAPAIKATEVHRKWHAMTLDFTGPDTHELNAENPFTDYRLLVEFSHPDKHYRIRGYYAADGNAAETGASAGSVWRVKFAPDLEGLWNYKATLQHGDNIAINDNPEFGQAINLVNAEGQFNVVASNKPSTDFRGKGRLGVDGGFFRFAQSKEYWLKRGANSPENLLAYSGFDGTYRIGEQTRDGEANAGLNIHAFASHKKDWDYGDPVWGNGKGKEIIGLTNYLSSMGMNAQYFLTLNIQGDGKDVWPYVDHKQFDRFDVSRLEQWDIVFQHMQAKGILLHFVTQETENELLLDNGNTGPLRKLYYRELIARFGHHLALVWDLGEENGPAEWTPNAQNDEQRVAMSNYIKASDPYKSPVIIHTHATAEGKEHIQGPMLGLPSLDGLSFQVDEPGRASKEITTWRKKSAEAGKTWLITMDEIGPWQAGALPDSVDPAHNSLRKEVLWGTFMAGGAGIEWYFGAHHPGNDLTVEDLRGRHNLWQQTSIAAKFIEGYPYWNMSPMHQLSVRDDDYCLALEGETYIVYVPDNASKNILRINAEQKFQVAWFNPREGGDMVAGVVTKVSSNEVDFGVPPEDSEKDWVAVISVAK